ncbi:MAG: helix-turn-helix domain-containing protein [Calditrichota bacterium]
MGPKALQKCSSYPWPGNVRELENICQRLAALIDKNDVQLNDLPDEIKEIDHSVALLSLEETEKKHIQRVISTASDLSEAAEILKIDPATLWRKRKKYGL